MKWTIGMPCFNNDVEVWFTVQALRLYHDLTDCEIVVIDNYGSDQLMKFVQKNGGDTVRYYRETDVTGVSHAKNKVFEHARGEYVLIMDSHILIKPGALDHTPPGDDMIQGPLIQSSLKKYWCEWLPTWRKRMWGIWGKALSFEEIPKEPFEIWAMGAGFFAVRRDSWLGFNKNFRGFGAETGYIQEKYRQAGRKVWCYPNMIWMHMFYHQGRQIPYPLKIQDRVRNYIYAFEELGFELTDLYKEFGEPLVKKLKAGIK